MGAAFAFNAFSILGRDCRYREMEEAHPKERSLLLRAAVLIFFTSSFWDLGQGPVLVTVQYVIDPAKASEFLHQIYKYQRVRRRDGATSWGVFVDTKAPDTYLESFKVDSWAMSANTTLHSSRPCRESGAWLRYPACRDQAFHQCPGRNFTEPFTNPAYSELVDGEKRNSRYL